MFRRASFFGTGLITRRTFIFPHSSTRFLTQNPNLKRMLATRVDQIESRWEAIYSKVDLDDIGGNIEIKKRLSTYVQYLTSPNRYTQKGIKKPQGAILSGAPGVGKTELVKAIAGHAGAKIITVNGPEMLNCYVGNSEALLKNIFETARKNTPCVICFDEIDAWAIDRSNSLTSGSGMTAHSLVNTFLSLLTQDDENTGIVIIGTTNYPERLDSAVVRAGRLGNKIEISLPDLQERVDILQKHSANKKLHSSVSLEDLAKLSVGFSGAKLAEWINDAATIAAQYKTEFITSSDFKQARSFLQSGIGRRIVQDVHQRRVNATHESAHALVGHLLKRTIYSVSILQTDKILGLTEFLPQNETQNTTRNEVLDQICIALAGRAAEEIFGIVQVGSEDDIKNAIAMAYHIVKKEGMGSTISGQNYAVDVELMLLTQKERAKKILHENGDQHQALIEALVNYHELSQTEFIDVLAGKEINPKHSIQPSCSLPLSRKNEPKIVSDNGFFKTPVTLGFSKEDISSVLRKKIRSIEYFGGDFYIWFAEQPDEDNDSNKYLAEKFSEGNIKFYKRSNALFIPSSAVFDFVEFIKNENQRKHGLGK